MAFIPRYFSHMRQLSLVVMDTLAKSKSLRRAVPKHSAGFGSCLGVGGLGCNCVCAVV